MDKKEVDNNGDLTELRDACVCLWGDSTVDLHLGDHSGGKVALDVSGTI